jgi:hypothetical protein
MRGKVSSDDLEFNPEIERTARALRKAVRLQRLSQSVPPGIREQIPEQISLESETTASPKSAIMEGVVPPRPKLGDYGLATHRGQLTPLLLTSRPPFSTV